jgi:hypothetical protein
MRLALDKPGFDEEMFIMKQNKLRLIQACIVCLTEAIRLAHDLLGMIFNYSFSHDTNMVIKI